MPATTRPARGHRPRRAPHRAGGEGAALLPPLFVQMATEWLGAEAGAFLEACAQPPRLALRANGLKGGLQALLPALDASAATWPRVPWWPEALLPPPEQARLEGTHPETPGTERTRVGFQPADVGRLEALARAGGPGEGMRRPGVERRATEGLAARAGALYAQDPAALAAVAVLDPRSGERVLDLCAAPGGKSTAIADRIADRMAGEGLLVANDVEARRARELRRTLERWGVTTGTVLALPVERLAALAPGFFDRVLVDAPCSGEAMFARRERAATDWSPAHVAGCAARQDRLLASARALVRPGGLLVYATCTFNPRENEAVIAAYLAGHPEDTLEDAVARVPGASPGRPDLLPPSLAGPRAAEVARCARLWPHRGPPGAGHFVAAIRTAQGALSPAPTPVTPSTRPARDPIQLRGEDVAAVEAVVATVARDAAFTPGGRLVLRGESAFLVPAGLPATLEGAALAPGLAVAERRGRTWRPAHALAMALRPAEATQASALDDGAAAAFLAGEPVACMSDGLAGLLLATWHDYPLGWARARAGALTPLLPRGLRAPIPFQS